VALRLLTDEHISPEGVAYRLASLGYDVVPMRDRGLASRRVQDWDLLTFATREDRALCTKNRADFERLHHDCLARGDLHAGVLVVPEELQAGLFAELRRYLENAPDDLINQIVYL
jgi:hypothetical protein